MKIIRTSILLLCLNISITVSLNECPEECICSGDGVRDHFYTNVKCQIPTAIKFPPSIAQENYSSIDLTGKKFYESELIILEVSKEL